MRVALVPFHADFRHTRLVRHVAERIVIGVGRGCGLRHVVSHHIRVVVDGFFVTALVDVAVENASLVEELRRSAHVPTAHGSFSSQEIDLRNFHDVERRVEHIVFFKDAARQHRIRRCTLAHARMDAFAQSDDAGVGRQDFASFRIDHVSTVVLEQRHIAFDIRMVQAHQQTFKRRAQSSVAPCDPNHVERMAETEIQFQQRKFLVDVLDDTACDGFLSPFLRQFRLDFHAVHRNAQFQRVGEANPRVHTRFSEVFVL